jgi:hypothetical protein
MGTKLYISNLDFGVSNDDIKVKASPDQHRLRTKFASKQLAVPNLLPSS